MSATTQDATESCEHDDETVACRDCHKRDEIGYLVLWSDAKGEYLCESCCEIVAENERQTAEAYARNHCKLTRKVVRPLVSEWDTEASEADRKRCREIERHNRHFCSNHDELMEAYAPDYRSVYASPYETVYFSDAGDRQDIWHDAIASRIDQLIEDAMESGDPGRVENDSDRAMKYTSPFTYLR